jgi:hypothetical protein
MWRDRDGQQPLTTGERSALYPLGRIENRAKWLQAAAHFFDLIYNGTGPYRRRVRALVK